MRASELGRDCDRGRELFSALVLAVRYPGVSIAVATAGREPYLPAWGQLAEISAVLDLGTRFDPSRFKAKLPNGSCLTFVGLSNLGRLRGEAHALIVVDDHAPLLSAQVEALFGEVDPLPVLTRLGGRTVLRGAADA